MEESHIVQLEEGWNEIKFKALNRFEQMLSEGFNPRVKLFSNSEYVQISTVCYNMCTQPQPYNWSEQLYERHGNTFASYLTNSVLPSLRDISGENLIQEFVRHYRNHKIMNRWMGKFFAYLDRYYVKYHMLPLLEDSGNRKFKNIVFDEVKVRVCCSIIHLINTEREGATIDSSLIHSAIQVFKNVDLDWVYVTDFEEPFIQASRENFSRKAEEWMHGDSLSEYLRKVEKFIEEEKLRVNNYLPKETLPKLLRAFDQEVFEEKQAIKLEREACKDMLLNDKYDDLARLFRLFSRLPNMLALMADVFKQHVIYCGEEKIDQRTTRIEKVASVVASSMPSTSSSAPAKECDDKDKENLITDFPQFTEDLLAVQDKYSKVVKEQFNSHVLFQNALKDAFVDIVNREEGKTKTADLMGLFCDRLLTAGSGMTLSDLEKEDLLERCVQLFFYLTDKDLFAEIYRTLLSKRLLNQRSASYEIERLMIAKLKIRCGAQFTAKMEGMLTDLAIGIEHATNFTNYCKDNESRLGLGKLDFSVQILTHGYWPSFKIIDVNLGPRLTRCCAAYKEYYDAHSSHRKLTWVHSLGTASLKATFNKKSYELTLTTLQAVVLLAFNASSSSSDNGGVRNFDTLQTIVNLSEEVLKRVLHSLACGKHKVIKRLTPEGGAAPAANVIKTTDVFQFNDSFASPMRKVRIPMASLEDNQSSKKVEEDRTIAIEAAIVRIMKVRKTLQHQQLVAEVLTQLAFFKPDPKVVKRRIEALIDREYLKREPEAQNVYCFLA